jgi:hypothetical protein
MLDLRVILAALALACVACDDAPNADAADTGPGGGTDSNSDTAQNSPDTADTAGPTDTANMADTGPSADTAAPPVFCEGTTRFDWDPTAGQTLAVFPDDALTRDDPSTLTGLRVDIGEPQWLSNEPTLFQPLWRQTSDLDGFGTSAGIVLRFSAPVAAPPDSAAASLTSDAIALWDLGALGDPQAKATRVAYEAQVLDEGATLLLWPIRPLREQTLHAVVVANHPDANGGCIAPSAPLRALLSGADTDPASARLASRFAHLRALVPLAPGEISALSLFTTQAITPVTLEQRDDIRATTYDWAAPPTCSTTQRARVCSGTFEAKDYRREGYLGTPTPPSTYRLPVHLWLPKDTSLTAPVMVFGHGLGGDSDQARIVALTNAENGIATVALSAPRHGDHPTARSDDPNAFATDLFGIDLDNFTIDGFVFRENLRQAAFDKLQALALLRSHPDLDGDGTPDLDLDRIAYWGVSLGGIMGPDFTALSGEIDAAIYSIAGARMLSIATESRAFGSMMDLIAELAGGRDALLQRAAIAQCLLDAGDPVNWAAQLGDDRAAGRPTPHTLVQMVIGDAIVPNAATRVLARALELPLVPTVIAPIDPLRTEAAAPVHHNFGAVTAGLFQFDRASKTPGGAPFAATHTGVYDGIEAIDQVRTFLEGWLQTADHVPWIVDPYFENGTPPLP